MPDASQQRLVRAIRAFAPGIAGVLLLAGTARAQAVVPGSNTELVERLRVQGGFITESRSAPTPRTDDVWIGVVPQLTLTLVARDFVATLDYQLVAAVHSLGDASEVANLVNASSQFDLSSRTRLLLSGSFAQSSLSNYLQNQPVQNRAIALGPVPGSRVITARLGQGLSHDISSRWRFEQTADAGVFTTLAPTPPIDSFTTNLGLALDHLWRNDAVGVEAHGGYGLTQVIPPLADQAYITVSSGPRWRRDWTPSFNSSVAAGGSVLIPTQTNAESRFGPFARASLLYTWAPTIVDLTYTTGFFPSVLSGQILQSHQVTLRGTTPISEHHRVYSGASIGYLHANLLDLQNAANDQTFDALLTDVDLTWQVHPLIGVFGRYQFITQIGEVTTAGLNPSFLRDTLFVGVQLSSQPTISAPVSSGFPQRVDGTDSRAPGQRSPQEGAERLEPNEPAAATDVREDNRIGVPKPFGPGPSRWIYTVPNLPPKEDPAPKPKP